jgi:protein SCO1/2
MLLFLALACAGAVQATALPGDSVYQLPAQITDQDGKSMRFDGLAGQVRVVSMFYSSCPYICPMIVETIKRIESKLDEGQRARLSVALISLDPERDTVAELKKTAALRPVDEKRWRLVRTDAAQVRKLAAVLGVQYRQLENREFNHSSALVLLDAEGRVLARSSTIGDPDPEFIAAVRAALGAKP